MATKADITSIDNRLEATRSDLTKSLSDLQLEIKKQDKILSANSESRVDLSGRIDRNTELISSCQNQHENLSNRIDGIARSRNKTASDLSTELEHLKTSMAKQNAEMIALRNEQALQAKAINSQLTGCAESIARPPPPTDPVPQIFTTEHSVLNVIVEGLVEEPDENLANKFKLVCESLDVAIGPNDIVIANRIYRRKPILGRPNPPRITLHDTNVKERIMAKKADLREREDLSSIWINHDEPAVLRRAKGRARHIATFARKKGFAAQLNSRGIVLNNTYYPYENLNTIPSIFIPPNALTIPMAKQPDQRQPMRDTARLADKGAAAGAHMNDPLDHPPTNFGNIRPTNQPTQHTRPPPTWPKHRPTEMHGAPDLQSTLPPPTWPKPKHGPIERPDVPVTPLTAGIEHLPNASGPNPSCHIRILPKEKMRVTKMGLVYSGQTARFSHLYKIDITIEGRPFNSVEQKIQHDKAILAREFNLAARIMKETNTRTIMDLGNEIPLSPEWIKARKLSAAVGNEVKFKQHNFLMEALLATGDTHLIEGTTSSFWGGRCQI